MCAIYLLHFIEPYRHAQHYLGWSPEVQARVNAHLHGKGARLTEVVHEAGIDMVLVRVWEDGDRRTERKLKNRHRRHLCPICQGLAVQMPLLLGEPAYVPMVVGEQPAPNEPYPTTIEDVPPRGFPTDSDQPDLFGWDGLERFLDELDRAWLASQGIDVGAELQELQEAMADEEDWRNGRW